MPYAPEGTLRDWEASAEEDCAKDGCASSQTVPSDDQAVACRAEHSSHPLLPFYWDRETLHLDFL